MNKYESLYIFDTHCQLSKFTMQNMPSKTKLTSLINTQGLTDGSILNNGRNNGRNSGGRNWLKTF